MDQTGIKRPKTNSKWLWWGLGSFFALVLAFQLGIWSTGLSLEGSGKKVGIVNVVGPILSSESTVKELEKFRERGDVSAIVVRIDSPGGLVAPTQEIYEKIKVIYNPIKDVFLDRDIKKDNTFLYVGRANDPVKRINLVKESLLKFKPPLLIVQL